MKWLADYLQDNPIETSGARCSSPRRLANKRISQIKSKKFRCSGNQVMGVGAPHSDSEYSSPREASNPIWRTASAVMAPRELLCKLNWGNSVSPTESQLPYGFKIKHTHTIKAWGMDGQLGRNRTQTQLLFLDGAGWREAGQPSHMCTGRGDQDLFCSL